MAKKYYIGNFEFETKKEYQNGLADVRMINYITHNTDIYNPQTALRLYNMIRDGRLELHSPIGDQFYNDLVDIVMNHTGTLMKWTADLRAIPQRAKNMKISEDKPKKILGAVCLVAACICFIWYFWTEYTNSRGEQISEELRQLKVESESNLVSNDGYVPEEQQDIAEETTESEADAALIQTSSLSILPEYQAIYEQNTDFIGWLTIEDTNIDYPVMQTVSDPTYYLRRNFNKEEDNNGTLFIDYRDSITNRSTNIIIYGHNMKSSMMFGQLKNYQDSTFWQEHKYIEFDTLYEKATYQVFAVCLSEVEYQDENAFRYYDFIQADTQEQFDEFINNISAMAVQYEADVATFGDQFITLSTCNSYTEDGRLFIVAKKCTDAE